MENNIITNAKFIIALIGGWLTSLLGGYDLALHILLIAIGLDILTGVLKAIYMQKLSSKQAYKGGIKKIGIFIVVALACAIDQFLNLDFLRYCAIAYYISDEGISIVENWGQMDLPLPKILKTILDQLKEQSNEGKVE